MIDLNTLALCTFEDAKAFKNYDVPQILFVGSPVYELSTGKLFHISSLYDETGYMVDFDLLKRQGLDISSEAVSFEVKDIIKAYSAAELGLLLPHEYIAPINTERGWAWMGNDGNIITADQAFYKREVDARSKFLLYFLQLKVIDLQELVDTWNNNLKLLA